VAPPNPPRDEDANSEEESGRSEGAAEDILRVDDPRHDAGGIDRLGMGAQHRVAEQDQHQRRRHHDAERAGDANRGKALLERHAARGELGLDDAHQRRDARSDRAGHRRQQRAEADRRHKRPRPGAGQQRGAGAKQDVGERQMVEQRAHEDIERERLKDVALEEADDTRRDGGEQMIGEDPGGDAQRRKEDGDADQHGEGGQPGGDEPDRGERQHPEAGQLHRDYPRPRGRTASSSAWTRTSTASSQPLP